MTRRALALAAGLTAALATWPDAPSAQQPQPPPADTAAPAAQAATPPAVPAPAAQAKQGASSQTPAFRSVVDIVSLNVTVSDSTGRYITDLDEKEFLVFENGVQQELTFFSHRQNPIALSMLLDSSASMEGKLPTLQTAATTFVTRLKPADMAQIVEFDGTVNIRQQFTSNHTDLQKAIQVLHAGGSTALHNAIYIALKELKKVEIDPADENPRRQALVVFSDGQDTSSLIPFEEVLDLAKRSETAIYSIGLRDLQDQARGFNQAEFVLRQLAVETGGRAFFPSSITELSGVYSQIADELSSQYALGYSSKNTKRDGSWRRVVVQVSRPKLTSRTKQGYYAPTNR